MKQGTYSIKVCLRPTGMAHLAYCTCTAGLGGVCNHVAGLLYALEDYTRLGLKAEDETS